MEDMKKAGVDVNVMKGEELKKNWDRNGSADPRAPH